MDIKGILEKMRAEGQIGPNADKSKQLALRGSGQPPKPQSDSDSDSESEAEVEELPPGPIDANRCDAKGPGFAGAAAGAPVKLVITAKDSSGKRIREGGAYIQVYVEPVSKGQEQQPRIDGDITDHGDGTYTAFYTVPSKGNYKLHIDINGQPMNDSPFPVFFSAPEALPALPAIPALPVSAPAAAPVPDAAASPSTLQASAPQIPMSGAMLPAFSAAFPNLGGPGMNLSLGQQAVQVGVKFPSEDPNKLSRMLLVGGVSPFATTDQLRSVFGFCGAILSIELAGPANSYAFVEYGSAGEATAALAMNGVQLLGQHMNVENARAAKADADSQPPPAPAAASMPIPAATSYAMLANPYLSAQMQQLQQFQMLTQQQAALAEQVANMRAMQRTGAQAVAGGGDAQKNAALAAALALSKRLAGASGGEANGGVEGGKADAKDRKHSRRSRSRSPGRSRRSRSRGRRDKSRDRRRSSPERRRGRSSDRKSDRHKDRRDRDRRDGWERERPRDRGGRDERSSRHGREERRSEKSSRREKSRDREGRRDRSKNRGRKSKRDRSRDGDEGRGKQREGSPEGGVQREAEEGQGQQQQAVPPAKEQAAGDDLEELLNELGE